MATYRTKQGDSFDTIAHRVLGDVAHTPALMRKNTAYLDHVTFPAGILLELPEVEKNAATPAAPWKKVSG